MYTALMSDLDDVVDPPDQRDQVECHEGARVIVLGHLHLGQAETLCCTLKENKIHKQYSTAFVRGGGACKLAGFCLKVKFGAEYNVCIL